MRKTMNTRGKKRERKYEGHVFFSFLERTDKAFLLSVCVSVFVPKRSLANPNNRKEIHCQLGFIDITSHSTVELCMWLL